MFLDQLYIYIVCVDLIYVALDLLEILTKKITNLSAVEDVYLISISNIEPLEYKLYNRCCDKKSQPKTVWLFFT